MTTPAPHIPFGDLSRQQRALSSELQAAFKRVLASGWYVLGREVSSFETEFAAYCGALHCVGVASGFDALSLALAALDIGPGDEVITVANACTYQVAAILQTGAQPVLVDSHLATHMIDVQAVEAAVTPRTRALLPVHLYGRMADMPALCAVATRHGLAVVEDAAQAHGAWIDDGTGHTRRAGSWGARTCACYSFYPTKNLGALGDGGAVVTDDAALAERLRRLRQYGWSSKYVASETGGRNARLDEMQAALLRVKLRYLDAWNAARRERAAWYRALFSGLPLERPVDAPGHVYHLYVITCDQRDDLRQHLAAAGIGSDVHYPLPAHMQPAYTAQPGLVRPQGPDTLPHSERQAGRVLSLPLYPELTHAEVEQVGAAVRAWAEGTAAQQAE
jgi:dTDP-4-amino-4,6-dideoxygalactose transaminase